MSDANLALVCALYAAQSRGDLETYLSLLAHDFVMHIPGRSQIAGDYVGIDDMRRHFKEIKELSAGTFKTGVHDVVAGAAHVVALVDARAERGGVVHELPRVHVWHVRDGKLAEMWLQPLDQYAFDDYWG